LDGSLWCDQPHEGAHAQDPAKKAGLDIQHPLPYRCVLHGYLGPEAIFSNIIAPMSASVYATLLFFIASAAYRAFQIRNSQATILLVTAVVTM
jgi:hypothetical protein